MRGISGCKFQKDSVNELINAVHRLESMDFIYDSTFKNYSDKYTEDINYKTLMCIYRKM